MMPALHRRARPGRPIGSLPPLALAALVCLPSPGRPQAPVVLPADATLDQVVAGAAAVRPAPRQLAWQQHEFTAFVHFGINTFTDREWGDGTEDPARFAPTDLDAGQWVETFRRAGMRGVVLTAKHHDGFCLWPTASTTHGVASSPWRAGKGDVVREVADACRAAGLSFGVYLSPWDRNHPSFGQPAYQQVFLAQLEELCRDYGPLFEVWFDGAHCPADDPAVFDWQAAFAVVRRLQPSAVIAITGPDVRWVGNEAGQTRAAEWSVLPLDDPDAGDLAASRAAWRSLWRLRERNQAKEIGGRSQLTAARRLIWWPAETDVSIRPGWFWHAKEDAQVKPLSTLLDYWFAAVGGNAVLLLNVPANRAGRIPEPDAAVLADLGAYTRATFATDLAADGRRKSYAKAGEVYFEQPVTVDVIDLREDLAAAGQCVERFRIDTWNGNQWRTLTTGGTIGFRRLLRLPPTTAHGFRYWIEQSRGKASVHHFSLHRTPSLLAPPTIARDAAGAVCLDAGGAAIHYTLDGSRPTAASPRYEAPLALPRGGTVRAIAVATDGQAMGLLRPAVASATFGLLPAGFSLLDVSSEQAPGEAARNAFDDDPGTIWHTRWSPDNAAPPHHLAIDLGETVTLTGFTYLPRADGDNGTIADFSFAVRFAGGDWRTVQAGTFPADRAGPITVRLAEPIAGVRAVRLTALRERRDRPWASCAELGILVQ